MQHHTEPAAHTYTGMRTRNACDACKARKVKCNGLAPCSYCTRRQRPQHCHYSPQRRRPRVRADEANGNVAGRLPRSPPASVHSAPPGAGAGAASDSASEPVPMQYRSSYRLHPTPASSHLGTADTPSHLRSSVAPAGQGSLAKDGRSSSRGDADAGIDGDADVAAGVDEHYEHEEAEVPREARLLCDAQGKLIFIGDCAPLSFFQTVRQLVTTRVDPEAFAPQTSRYTVLENTHSRHAASLGALSDPPAVKTESIGLAVSEYLSVTSGLVDLFDNARLVEDISLWANQGRDLGSPDDMTPVVNYLVLAIGFQKSDRDSAQTYFDFARHHAFANLTGNLGVGNVQVFILITLFMLGSCQINGAFLFFGIAVRAAYSIGIHRTEVNARFGPDIHRQRDRLWKSLRVVDLFLSASMGRPPSASDVDCTVAYRGTEDGHEVFDLLNASAQIFLIIEGIVLEVYSRKKISLQLVTEGISRELRDWSTRWLPRLKDALGKSAADEEPGMANGACQVLATYYYAVILVSRPFLMYELHRRLSDGHLSATSGRNMFVSGKSKLVGDACIDAASLMVDPVQDLIARKLMTRRAPALVSWLFASSLVLGLGLLGGFGRIIEKHCRSSISSLEYFAETDAHAMQYCLIAKSLLNTALEFLEKREAQERLRRTESSSQLFGLIPRDSRIVGDGCGMRRDSSTSCQAASPFHSPLSKETSLNSKLDHARSMHHGGPSPHYGFDLNPSFMGLTDPLAHTPDFSLMGGPLDPDSDSTFGALNLFPLLDTSGHIDLANYL